MAGIAGGVSAGIGASGAFARVGSTFASGALSGASGSALSQGIGVALGLQKKFDFAGVAAAGLAGGVSAGVGKALGAGPLSNLTAGNIAANLAASTAGAIANAAARSLIMGSSFGDNLIAALPDVIGSTVGNLIAHAAAGNGSTAYDGDGITEPFEGGSMAAPGETGAGEIVVNIGALDAAAAQAFGVEFDLGLDLDLSLPTLTSDDPVIAAMIENARLRAELVYGGIPLEGGTIATINSTHFEGGVAIAGGPANGDITLAGYINSIALDGHTGLLGRHFFDNNPGVYFSDPAAFRARIAAETAHNDFMLRENISNLIASGDRRFQPYIEQLQAEVNYRWENGGRERAAIADRASWDLFTFGIQPLNTGTAAFRMFINGEYNLQNGIAVGGAFLGPAASLGSRLFSRVGRVGAEAADVVPEGVIYLRTDLSGNLAPYIGQAKSLERFVARQTEHARANPFSDFEFSIVARAEPGVALDIAEHTTLQGLTGGVRASRSSAVSNRVDPIGAQRRIRLGIPHPRN